MIGIIRSMLQFLNKFVDVDKAQGVYFINDEKVGTPEGNFTEKDYQELQLVSPGNRAIFEGKLNFLNEKLAEVATRSDVSQIVYSTYGGDTWVRPLQSNPAISIEKSDNLDVRATRALLGQMYLYYGATQYCNFQGARQIKSNVNIVLYSYEYYFIEVVCKVDDASKSPDLGYPTGGDKAGSIVLSGSTSSESYPFTWTVDSDASIVGWQFEGIQHAPSGMSSISVDFLDY